MEQENSQQKWDEKLPAESRLQDKQKFKSIPKEERANYIKKMLADEQLPGPPPFSFKKNYPSEDKFNYQNYNLHYYAIQANLHPKAVLFLFHGMGAHSEFSGYFANTIWENCEGVNVYAIDQMNFGKSEGPFRGLIESLEDSVRQSEHFVDFILGKLKSKPKVFLGGMSYGGAISIQMSINTPNKYAGLILLAPALRVAKEAFGFLIPLVKILGYVIPKVRLYKQKDFKAGTRYNNKEELLADQYLYNDGLIPHMRVAALKAMEQISSQFHLVSAPYILFQGGHDKFVDPFAPLDLQQVSPSKDKTTLYCEQMWHAVYGERQIQQITQVCIKWLKKRI